MSKKSIGSIFVCTKEKKEFGGAINRLYKEFPTRKRNITILFQTQRKTDGAGRYLKIIE